MSEDAPDTRSWAEVSPSPVSRANIGRRDRELNAAYTVETRSRFDFIVDMCRDQVVLDIGCVGQFKGGLTDGDGPPWLHGRIACVASRCVGIDNDEPEVQRMRSDGYEAFSLDITRDIGPLEPYVPFDVVVAGEVIEHVGDPQGLIEGAAGLLKSGGALILTTPNPFAPWRAYAGMRRQTWENVDHVLMLFPSGVAELAHRSGMSLEVATTVGAYRKFMTPQGSIRVFAGQLARKIIRRPDVVVGYVNPIDAFFIRRLRHLGQLNDTSLYVLRRE